MRSVITAAGLTQASASSVPAIPWLSGIQSRVVLPAHLLSMRLRSEVSAEPLWIALRSDWLSVQMAAASYGVKSRFSVMRIATNSCSALLLGEGRRAFMCLMNNR